VLGGGNLSAANGGANVLDREEDGGQMPAAEGPVKLREVLLKGAEPPPVAAIARLPSYPWFVVGTVCIGSFMGQVDASIAQLVLPVLERDFGLRLSALSWISVAYLLALAVLLPVFGRLADLYGRKLMYTGGFLLFIFGSALCGAADNFAFLVAFRVVQAIGAALLQANSVAIVVSAAGPGRRGRAIGMQAAAQAVGLSAGPALGGLLISVLSWRWVFWVNVPFGLLGAAIGWAILPQTAAFAADRRFDWPGALLLAPGLTAVVILVNQGEEWGFASPVLLFCAATALVLLPLFVRHEQRRQAPLLDLALFRRHAFWAGNLAGLLSYATLFGMFFLMPFVFERAYREGALAAGLRLATIPVALGLLSPLSGALYDRLRARVLTGTGMAVSVVAFALLILFLHPGRGNLLPLTAALALFGIGQGLFTSPNNSSIMGAAPSDLTGEAAGVLNTMRSFGTSVGIAAAAAVLAWRLAAMMGRVVTTAHAPAPALLAASRDVILTFALFALIAGALSWSRPHPPRRADAPHAVE
jgi:EmrB/QacA subfamily drug resistance transporter